jgi:hypothetical protein
MSDKKEHIPTNEEIALKERLLGRMFPGAAEELRGRRLDALERLDAVEKAQERLYAKISLWVTCTSVLVAILAVCAAFWASLEAHWTRLADERPFLSAEVVGAEDFMQLRSLGKSPAVKIEAVCVIDQDEQSIDWQRVFHPARTDLVFRYFALIPGQTEGIRCMRSQFHGLDEVRYGNVQYKDTEGHSYQTPFCYSQHTFEGNTSVHACIGTAKGTPDIK